MEAISGSFLLTFTRLLNLWNRTQSREGQKKGSGTITGSFFMAVYKPAIHPLNVKE